MAKIVVNNTMEQPNLISQKTKEILTRAADESKNPTITINSGWRSPSRQANAMYNNLVRGVRIRYKAPGQAVCKVYDDNAKKSKEEVITLMVKKINELSAQGQRTSLHCVSESDYQKLNIVDLSKYIPNPRDFVKSLIKDNSVTRVITPYSTSGGYNSAKVSVDVNEQSIHVEIRQ